MYNIQRKEYLSFLIAWKDKPLIKVVSGLRRCGKSTLFGLYRDYLLQNGVNNDQIVWINFEDLAFETLLDYRELYKFVLSRIQSDRKTYIFLDEIQHVPAFEKAVDSLLLQENADVYITGSNAYFMSGELATLLSGRYVELQMLPLSFREYCEGFAVNYPDEKPDDQTLYAAYINESSLPYALSLHGCPHERNDYLIGIYNTVLVKDVIARHKINDVMMLESVAKFVFDNIGNILSTRSIAGALNSNGRKVDPKTVEKYLTALTQSLIVHKVARYNIKGKALLATLEKYYVADLGLRNVLLGSKGQDQGHILENVIYLELLRRGYTVHIGTMGDNEIDFVATDANTTAYYQVAATVLEQATLKRELSPLEQIDDNFPKYLLTLDTVGANSVFDGIRQLNALDWLLGKTVG